MPRFHFPRLSFPFAALLLLVLSFGLMIYRLGLYWDDWPVVLAARHLGVGSLWSFYAGERPFSAWTYILTIPILGTHPLTWHIFTLLLRWLAVLAYWWTLRSLWPSIPRQVAWMAMLFAIYPVFLDQSVAVAFSQHWITYTLFCLSLGMMVQALRRPAKFWLLTILALAMDAIQALTMEYFWGLEFLRFIILLIVSNEINPNQRRNWLQALKYWLPYFWVLLISVVVRFTVYIEPGSDPNRPVLLISFFSDPFQTMVRLLQVSLQDFIHNLIGAWYQVFTPSEIDFTSLAYLASLAVAGLVAFLVVFFNHRAYKENGEPATDQPAWLKPAAILGVAGALLGPLPVWMKERTVIEGLHSGRFALAAMFGLSILIVAGLEWSRSRREARIWLLAILIGLSAGYHLREANSYYKSTLRQNNFYWQLFWRAPYILPNTAILSADELFPYVGRNPTAMAVNLLYPQTKGESRLAYWFLELYQGVGPLQVPKLARGRGFSPTFRNFSFSGSSLDSLVIFYKPGGDRCLWVLSPRDALNPDIPELTRQAVAVSNYKRIETLPVSENYPDQALFGRQPAQTWCYFYQKAELARQEADWQQVLALGEQAAMQGQQPGNAYEWLPFLEAHLQSGSGSEASQLGEKILEAKPELAPMVCELLAEQQSQMQNQPGSSTDVLTQMNTKFDCQPVS